MLIRSQDKKSIVNINHIDTISVDEGKIKYFNGGGESMGMLGTYSTEEKAIKVLDMIQDAYLCTTEIVLSKDIIGKCLPRATVFQMPQDEDVEV